MIHGLAIAEDFRQRDSWRQARSVVCALLDVTASLSQNAEKSRFAHRLNSLSIAVLDNMAKGFEGEEYYFVEARSLISRLEKLITQGQFTGLLRTSEFIPLRFKLNLLSQALEGRTSEL